MSDELDKSEGDNGEDGSAGAERPTVSPPFDPAAFARDVLAKPSPARGIPAVGPDAHTHATPPQGMAAQAAAVELSRASKPPNEDDSSPDPTAESERKTADRSAPPPSLGPSLPVGPILPPVPIATGSSAPGEPTPDSIRSIAAQKIPTHEVPRIDVGPKKHDSLEGFNAVDREWAELEVATRPPPADAPDEDPVIEFSHEPGGVVNLDLDDIDPVASESPTAKRAKLPSMTEEAATAPVAIIPEAPAPAAAPAATPSAGPVASKKPPPGEREMNDRVSVGDYSGALEIAEAILAEKPQDKAARECAEQCRQVLRKMYAARIGPLDRVPSVAVARDQLRWLSIDHKAGFVLSLVDGVSSLEMIIDVSGMPELDTLRILSELAQQRIISLR